MNRVQPDTELPKEPAVHTIIYRLTQSGTEAPFATVIYKHGTIYGTWTRNAVGHYILTVYSHPDAILALNCATYITGTVPGKLLTSWPSTNNTVSIFTYDSATGTAEDTVLQQSIFRLDIY